MGLFSKSYQTVPISGKDRPVQIKRVDLVALDLEILFFQPKTRGVGEQHKQIHEFFLRQGGWLYYCPDRLLLFKLLWHLRRQWWKRVGTMGRNVDNLLNIMMHQTLGQHRCARLGGCVDR